MPPKPLELEFPDLRIRLAKWLKEAFADETRELSVEAFAAVLGRTKQTLYNHDKRVSERGKIARVISRAKERRTRLLNPIAARQQKRRGAAGMAKRIAQLEEEVILWKDRYLNVNELLLLIQEAARSSGIDLVELYSQGIKPPNREMSKARNQGRVPAGRRP